MAVKKNIITRKIELKFNTDSKEKRAEYYTTLFRWRNICVRGANQVCSHLYFMLMQQNFVYLKEKAKMQFAGYDIGGGVGEDFDLSMDDKKALMKVVNEAGKESLNTSHQNSFYRLLSHLYKGTVPTGILSSLNSVLYKNFNSERGDYLTGKRSLRVYKESLPIPFQSGNIRQLELVEDQYSGR